MLKKLERLKCQSFIFFNGSIFFPLGKKSYLHLVFGSLIKMTENITYFHAEKADYFRIPSSQTSKWK